MKRTAWGLLSLLLGGAVACGQQPRSEPLAGGTAGIGRLAALALPGVETNLTRAAQADGQAEALKLAFRKEGPERRLVALQAPLSGDLSWVKGLDVRYRVTGAPAGAAYLAAVLYQTDGGVHYKVAGTPATVGEFTTGRVSLTNLREAAFSSDASGRIEWDRMERVWLGLVIDGPATGALEISRAVLTNERFRPAGPLKIDLGQAEQWHASQDAAVVSKITKPNEGPNGEPVLRFDFTFPGGRHMYFIPGLALRVAGDLEGYQTIRYLYKCQLPKGPNLLFGIGEAGGGQYIIDPPVAPSAAWRTLDQPLDKLKLGGWSKDADNVFSLVPGVTIQAGCHGVANPGGPGVIWLAGLELLP